MERPLTDDVARPARSYLAALVPADEVSDAWHELLDDVAYWGDRDLLPVLRLAHQVVLQHERVTPEVAALALVEVGVDAPADVATVLDTDEVTAGRWAAQAEASREGDVAPPADAPMGRFADPARAPSAAVGRPVPAADAPDADPPAAVVTETYPSEPERPAPAGPRVEDPPVEQRPAVEVQDGTADHGAVRIGFDDDHPLPYADGIQDTGTRSRVGTRGILVVALVLWIVVLVLWAITR